MSQVKLSICIPTYNRAAFLEKALDYFVNLYQFAYKYEIVISDNASTDDTGEVVARFIAKGLPIRYLRQAENYGSGANAVSAFSRATGEYVLYLADDDILINDGMREAIRYLDLNPEVTACYAPWYTHDEVEERDDPPFYSVDRDTRFKKREFESVFDFLVERHVFPEIGIYRTSALRSAWVPRNFAYWAFAYLAHFLDQGAVAFLSKPFYRQVTRSKIARDRPQAGHADVLTAWDSYRGGLEYFLYTGAKRGAVRITPDRRAYLDAQVKDFTMVRMTVALRMWIYKKDYIRAYELYTRLMLAGFEHHPDVQRAKAVLPLMVALQTVMWHTNAVAEIDRLVLHGVDDRSAIEELLRDLGLRREIAVVPDTTQLTPEEIARTAVFVTADSDRKHYLRKGHLPNLVVSEGDILSHVLL
ncbi:MAG TPA: glycosyltransferase family 2 protein [Ensifer sp.]|uniref:glycosyltransferase family 2 protein n=1 Tax=Ensifer sp. TaxID=1872086 RepID=UPI002E149340|nr:glycosyltransferase family 2 protein [Ensifer sp.]